MKFSSLLIKKKRFNHTEKGKSTKKKKELKLTTPKNPKFGAENFCCFFTKILAAKKAQKTQIHDRQISLKHCALDPTKIRKSSVIFSANFFWTRISKYLNTMFWGPNLSLAYDADFVSRAENFCCFFTKVLAAKKSTKKANSRWTDITLARCSRLKKI